MTDRIDSFVGRASAITMYEVDDSTGLIRERPVRITTKLIIVGTTYTTQFKREYYTGGRLPRLLRFTPADARAAFQQYARKEQEKAERTAAHWAILSQMDDPQDPQLQDPQPAAGDGNTEEINAEEEIAGDHDRA